MCFCGLLSGEICIVLGAAYHGCTKVLVVVVDVAGVVVAVSWCFKPSQPQRIISGMKETFMKRYMVETTNRAEMRPEEQ